MEVLNKTEGRNLALQWHGIAERMEKVRDNLIEYRLEGLIGPKRESIISILNKELDLLESLDKKLPKESLSEIYNRIGFGLSDASFVNKIIFKKEIAGLRIKYIDKNTNAAELFLNMQYATGRMTSVLLYRLEPKMFGHIIIEMLDLKREMLSNLDNIDEVMSKETKRIISIEQSFETVEKYMNKIEKFSEEMRFLKRNDSSDISLKVINLEEQLDLLNKKRAGIVKDLSVLDSKIEELLGPIRGVSKKYDYEMSNYQGRLTDFVDAPFSIIENVDNFFSKINTLISFVDKNAITLKRESERNRLLDVSKRIISRKEGDDLVATIGDAKELTNSILLVDAEINSTNENIRAERLKITQRDTEIDRIKERVAELNVFINEVNSEALNLLRNYGIEAEIRGREIKIVSGLL